MILGDLISQANATSVALNHLISQLANTTSGTGAGTEAGITAIVLAILGIASSITEYFRRNSQSNTRSDNIIKSEQERNDSGKETDAAIKDHADLFLKLSQLLISDPNLRKIFEGDCGRQFLDSVNRNVLEWGKDFSAYYEKKQQLPEDSSRDPVIRRTAEIRKSLEIALAKSIESLIAFCIPRVTLRVDA